MIIIGTGIIVTAPITTDRDGSVRISMDIHTIAMVFSILHGGMIPGIIAMMAAVFVRISR
jgi:hypothetical protein